MNPLEPRPGDWEAALNVIHAAEVRHDRRLLRRKRLGAISAVAALLILAFFGGGRLRDQEVLLEQQSAEVHDERFGTSVSEVAAVETPLPAAVEEVEESPADATVERLAEWAPVQRRSADQSVAAQVETNPSSESSEPVDFIQEPLMRIQLPDLLDNSSSAAFVPMINEDVEGASSRKWSVYAGREPGAWVAGVTASLWGDRMPALRLGTTWDQRSRQWVAHTEDGVFGPKPARGISSDEAHWVSAGADWTGHLKGRWGWAATCEGQFLVARLMTPSTYSLSESLVPGGPAVWGTLEEEQRIRFRWSVGAEWAMTERQSVRLAVGGYVTPERQLDYMDFTFGAPRTVGELRATWFWK